MPNESGILYHKKGPIDDLKWFGDLEIRKWVSVHYGHLLTIRTRTGEGTILNREQVEELTKNLIQWLEETQNAEQSEQGS